MQKSISTAASYPIRVLSSRWRTRKRPSSRANTSRPGVAFSLLGRPLGKLYSPSISFIPHLTVLTVYSFCNMPQTDTDGRLRCTSSSSHSLLYGTCSRPSRPSPLSCLIRASSSSLLQRTGITGSWPNCSPVWELACSSRRCLYTYPRFHLLSSVAFSSMRIACTFPSPLDIQTLT